MIDVLLHAGIEHPQLHWIVLASVGALAFGLAVGLFSERIRSWFDADTDDEASRH